ncbi:hypothetical protein AVEN_245358-1 [Araneus ventricosus]|uniref:Uncharacterized protein n=1 Tax=Araneus ventricosus TaxID=182803 RepID=A0A4Y2RFP1_ARAVE|nr:hypothetical protein AVEN_245358-1 [Araneus ventricosus]
MWEISQKEAKIPHESMTEKPDEPENSVFHRYLNFSSSHLNFQQTTCNGLRMLRWQTCQPRHKNRLAAANCAQKSDHQFKIYSGGACYGVHYPRLTLEIHMTKWYLYFRKSFYCASKEEFQVCKIWRLWWPRRGSTPSDLRGVVNSIEVISGVTTDVS